MSTVAELSLPAATTNASAMQRVVSTVFEEVENRLSLFRAESDVARLNRQAGSNEVAIGRHAAAVLAYALRVAEESGGAFDPTVGPLMSAWGFRRGLTNVPHPTAAALGEALAQTGWTNIVLSSHATPDGAESDFVPLADSAHASLRLAGMQLDLGAIAKGYAVDLAYEAIRQQGQCDDFLINLAGNMRGLGTPSAARRGWCIGVRDPLHEGAWLGTIMLNDGEGIATSGNYERHVTINGQRYAHIIDPRSGHPVKEMISVTVLAGSAMEADALSTALFVLDVEQRHTLLEKHPGCGAVYLLETDPPRLLVTPELRERFVPAKAWAASCEYLDGTTPPGGTLNPIQM